MAFSIRQVLHVLRTPWTNVNRYPLKNFIYPSPIFWARFFIYIFYILMKKNR